MVVALSDQNKVRFYASPDLQRWGALSDFGPQGAIDGVWECPDLFDLPVEGQTGRTRWVLDVDVGAGAPAGGTGGQYFVGEFDGTRFRSDLPADAPVRWVDHGRDFYASTSFSDLPESDSRRIWMGWLSNWEYAKVEPTPPWRGMQSVPREVRLVPAGDELVLAQQPVREVETLRGTPVVVEPGRFAGRRLLPVAGEALDIEAELRPLWSLRLPPRVRRAALGPPRPRSGSPPAARSRRPLVRGGVRRRRPDRHQRSHLPPADEPRGRPLRRGRHGGDRLAPGLAARGGGAALTNVSRPVRRGAATWPALRGRGRASRERPRRAPRGGRNAIRAGGVACRPAGPPRRPPRP